MQAWLAALVFVIGYSTAHFHLLQEAYQALADIPNTTHKVSGGGSSPGEGREYHVMMMNSTVHFHFEQQALALAFFLLTATYVLAILVPLERLTRVHPPDRPPASSVSYHLRGILVFPGWGRGGEGGILCVRPHVSDRSQTSHSVLYGFPTSASFLYSSLVPFSQQYRRRAPRTSAREQLRRRGSF